MTVPKPIAEISAQLCRKLKIFFCDIDDTYGKRSYDKWPQARKYRDFREMLDAEDHRARIDVLLYPDQLPKRLQPRERCGVAFDRLIDQNDLGVNVAPEIRFDVGCSE